MDAITREFEMRIEKVAERGAKIGAFKCVVVVIMCVIALAYVAYCEVREIKTEIDSKLEEFTTYEAPAYTHDLVIEDDGILGYTAADFAEAIIEAETRMKKLEVYEYEISDVATITDAGLFSWAVFSKDMIITYTGYARYTVDLGTISAKDISLDEERRTVTLRIPHPKMEHISIPTDKIIFGDVSKGLLAWGDIKMTPEESTMVQKEAEGKMIAKLYERKVTEVADRFAILSVWEMYQPLVRTVSPEYSLVVVFR